MLAPLSLHLTQTLPHTRACPPQAVAGSMAASSLLYCAIGVCGFLIWGEAVQVGRLRARQAGPRQRLPLGQPRHGSSLGPARSGRLFVSAVPSQ